MKVVKSERTPQDTPSQNRGILVNQMVSCLQKFRYRLTLDVSQFVANKMADIFDRDSFFGLFLGWFIFLPSLFLIFSLFVILLIPLFTLFSLLSFIFTITFGTITTSFIRPGASHVPTFYAPSTKSDRWSRMVVFALFGVLFGGIHCIGWNFNFPFDILQIFWRSKSVLITAIPLIVAPIDFLLDTRDIKSCATWEKVILLILDLVMTFLLCIYLPARLTIIALAFNLMWTQPPSAFTAIDWSIYLPRIFSFS